VIMGPRTKCPVASSFRSGYEHPAGIEVKLIEPVGLEGGAWYDHVELPITDLDFMPELEHDMRMMREMSLKERRLEDVALAIGSRELPRKERD
jgi:hypothetical protein